jgi:RNA polymerase sigma-70 factor (ECF subfamily)
MAEASSTPSDWLSNDERTQHYLTLLGQHEGRLLGFILSLVPHWADADDIAQEVRIRLWKQFDAYDPAKDFGAWARTIAYYQVLSYRQKRVHRTEMADSKVMELVVDEVAALSEELDASQRALKDCFDKLPPAKRELLIRYYSKNETTQSIAAESGRSCEATRQALVRARMALRQCVDEALRRERDHD